MKKQCLRMNSSDLHEILIRKANYSEYIDWEYSEHIQDAINELQELQEAILSKDKEEISKEWVDVIFTICQLVNKLLNDWIEFDFKQHKDKILKRSPNLKKRIKISREEENRLWHLNKKEWNH